MNTMIGNTDSLEISELLFNEGTSVERSIISVVATFAKKGTFYLGPQELKEIVEIGKKSRENHSEGLNDSGIVQLFNKLKEGSVETNIFKNIEIEYYEKVILQTLLRILNLRNIEICIIFRNLSGIEGNDHIAHVKLIDNKLVSLSDGIDEELNERLKTHIENNYEIGVIMFSGIPLQRYS